MLEDTINIYRQEIDEKPQYGDVITEAFTIVENLGIAISNRKGEGPGMPDDITSIDDQELGEFLNKQTQWAGFLSQKLAEYESYLNVLQNEFEFVQAYLHSEYLKEDDAKRTKVTERKEIIKTDKRYIHLNRKKLVYEVVCNVIKANLNATNNNWVNLSRQITLKGQDEQRLIRNNNSMNYVPSEAKPSSPSIPQGFAKQTIGKMGPQPPRRTVRK